MTLVTHTWYPGRPAVPLAEALTATLQWYDAGGIAEEAIGIARQNSEAIGSLVAALAERGVITPSEALQICGANYRYEIVDATAHGS